MSACTFCWPSDALPQEAANRRNWDGCGGFPSCPTLLAPDGQRSRASEIVSRVYCFFVQSLVILWRALHVGQRGHQADELNTLVVERKSGPRRVSLH